MTSLPTDNHRWGARPLKDTCPLCDEQAIEDRVRIRDLNRCCDCLAPQEVYVERLGRKLLVHYVYQQRDSSEVDPFDEDSTDNTDDEPQTESVEFDGEQLVAVNGDTIREKSTNADKLGIGIRDLKGVNAYLYADVYRELQLQYNAMNTDYLRAHNEQLEKNKVFINAVVRAGLKSDKLKHELEIE